MKGRKPSYEDIEKAVSAVTRTPVGGLRDRGPARGLLIRALRVLTRLSTREIGARVGLSHTAIRRIPGESGPEVVAVQTVLGDERFRALNGGVTPHDGGPRAR